MGYTTDFSGSVTIEPPLNEDEVSFLNDLNHTRRMHRRKGPLFVKGDGPFGQGGPQDRGDVLDHNRPDPDQPGLWCQWVPSDDGTYLEWDGGEKFYCSAEWMKYIVHNLLSESAKPYILKHLSEDPRLQKFTCNHIVNGEILAQGEDPDDRWMLVVENNVVKVGEAEITYKEARSI